MNMLYILFIHAFAKCINTGEVYLQITFPQQVLNMGAPIKFVDNKEIVSSRDPDRIEGKH